MTGARFVSALALLAGSASAVSPVEKVITLLEDLKTEVETEGKAEAATYDTFACFCKDNTASKSTAITDGKDTIDALSASIAENTATKGEKVTELDERKAKQEGLGKELDETVAQSLKESAEFEAELADLTKAISSMEKAITALTAAKPAFLQRGVLEEASASVSLAEALGLHAKAPELQAFLQQGVDPNDPAYKFKSSGVIELLEKLNLEFKAKKTDTQSASDSAKTVAEALKKGLSDEMETNGASMDTLAIDIHDLDSKIAQDRETLVSAEATLKDDQLYLQDLTERCESSARNWDQRSGSRNEELEALAEALTVIKDGKDGKKGVQELDTMNKRALIQHKAASAPAVRPAAPSFLQLRRGARQEVAGSAHDRAVEFLSRAGDTLKSKVLSTLATQIAADPFAKVKNMVQELIQRLLDEATEDATKTGFCNTELGKAKKDRDHRQGENQTLTAEIAVLEAKQGELTVTITKIKEEVPKLQDALATAETQRLAEKADNIASVKTAREGVVVVGEAIAVLQAFYSKAAHAKVLLQASPVDEDTQGPGFKDAYKGKQSAAGGIVGLLEVIKSDFARTAKQTEQAEKDAQASFVEFEQTSKSDIAGKAMTEKLSEEDLDKTVTATEQKTADLKTAQGLVDSALKSIEDLKPMCIDTGMSFDERVAKREEEIAALKNACGILDPEGTGDCE